MKKVILILAALILIRMSGKSQDGSFQPSLSRNVSFESATTHSLNRLQTALLTALNKNHTISLSNGIDFLIIQPSLIEISKDITNSAPPLISMRLQLNLSMINGRDGTAFHTSSIEIKGAGKTDNKAYSSAFSRIRFKQSAIDEFLEASESKVAEYFENNCDRIISEIEALTSVDKYDLAMLRLFAIPSAATKCHTRASELLLETHKLSQNRDCQKFLNIAESAIALRRFQEAAEALVQIDPQANCYQKAQLLKERIAVETKGEYDNIWNYKNQRLQIVGDALKSKYEAVSELITAETINRPGGTSSGSGGVSIVNNVGTTGNTPSQNNIEQPIENGEDPALFRIVSPAIRSASGSIVVHDKSVSIYGFIDKPGKAKKLLIDGLETSWDDNGVFSRDLAITDQKQEFEVTLENMSGKSTHQVLVVERKEPKPGVSKQKVARPSSDQSKVALVIGNNNYRYAGPLRNAKNDAVDIAEMLRSLGFEVATIYDATYEQMRSGILDFAKKIEGAGISLFYFSGHGIELDRTNYIIPVDAQISSPQDIQLKTIEVKSVLRSMRIVNDDKLNIVILDACRNNPFPSAKRGGAGLAKETPSSGMLIAYATEPGSVASDGSGENGLYTGELVKQMQIPQRIEDIFMNTRVEVERKSNGVQRPWEEARLKGVFYLKYED